jgi:2-phosphosulfolactate phosphatase
VIDVALTRADLRAASVAVVVDVLRATSTATQALAAGYRRVLCVETIERAIALRRPDRVLAGERHCMKPPGFDQGNSPIEARHRRGDELVLATTNGAPTIVAAASHAPHVLLACLLNLDAVIQTLRDGGDQAHRDVQIVCSGTDGALALEDLYLAGRLSAALPGGVRTDAALAAEAVAREFPTALEALAASSDADVLRQAGLTDDIAYCALESELEVVPSVVAASAGVAVIAPGDDRTVIARSTGTVDADDTVSVW